MKSRHSTAFDIAVTFITKIIFLGGSFIISIILARLLGPEGKGVFTALFVIPNMLVSLADLGVRQASAYYIGQKKYTLQEVLSTSLILWVLTSLGSIGVIVVYYLIPNTPDYSWALIGVAIAYVPIKILVSYFNGILQGQQKISKMNMKFIVEFAVRLVVVLLFVWILDLHAFGAALATTVATLGVLIYSGSIVTQSAKLKFQYIPGIPQDMLRKGIVFALALFVLKLNYKIDILFLENMVDAYDLGLYTVGVTLAELIWQLPTAIGVVVFSRSANSKSNKESSNRSAKLMRLTWIPLIIGSVIFWITAPYLVRVIYGEAFYESGFVIRFLLPGIIMMVLFKILNSDLSGRGKPLFALKIYLVTLLVNIVLNVILIPNYGIYGAAVSSTISYILGAVIFSIAYHRYTKLPYRELFILNKEDIILIKSLIKKLKTKIKRGV